MGQEIANSGEMTIALEYETRIEQERRKERKNVLLLVSQENPMELVSQENPMKLVSQENPMELVTAITTKNSPKVLTKRKGHSASIVRSGGHVSAQCPNKAENANYSGQWHKREDTGRAIIYQGTIEGKAAPRLCVDSGADRTLVHPSWIPKRAFVGKSQLFRNAWGDIKSLPLAEVQIVVGGKKYTLEVAVTKGLAYNALLDSRAKSVGRKV